jgi:hypothetical protein
MKRLSLGMIVSAAACVAGPALAAPPIDLAAVKTDFLRQDKLTAPAEKLAASRLAAQPAASPLIKKVEEQLQSGLTLPASRLGKLPESPLAGNAKLLAPDSLPGLHSRLGAAPAKMFGKELEPKSLTPESVAKPLLEKSAFEQTRRLPGDASKPKPPKQ